MLSSRSFIPEVMDQPALPPGELDRALSGLTRLNYLSRSADILWPEIAALAKAETETPLRILDIASGAGDVPLALFSKAQAAKLAVQVDGCDLNPHMVRFAEHRAAAAGSSSRFFQLDALEQPLPHGYDVVICSLFLHHLSETDARILLTKMRRVARKLLLINDLRRCRSGYLLAWITTRLVTRSRIVHIDGPRSVENAFCLDEVSALAAGAKLTNHRLSKKWPCRFLLSWGAEVDGA